MARSGVLDDRDVAGRSGGQREEMAAAEWSLC